MRLKILFTCLAGLPILGGLAVALLGSSGVEKASHADTYGIHAGIVYVDGKPQIRLRWTVTKGWLPKYGFRLYRQDSLGKTKALHPDGKTLGRSFPFGPAGGVPKRPGSWQLNPWLNKSATSYENAIQVAFVLPKEVPANMVRMQTEKPAEVVPGDLAFKAFNDLNAQIAQRYGGPNAPRRGTLHTDLKKHKAAKPRPRSALDQFAAYNGQAASGKAPPFPKWAKDRQPPPLPPEKQIRLVRSQLLLGGLIQPEIGQDLGVSLDDADVKAGGSYKYTLHAVNDVNAPDVAPVAIVTVKVDNAALPWPKDVRFKAMQHDADDVYLRWDGLTPAQMKVFGLATYNIYRDGQKQNRLPIVLANIPVKKVGTDLGKKGAAGHGPGADHAAQVLPPMICHVDKGAASQAPQVKQANYELELVDIFGRAKKIASLKLPIQDWHIPVSVEVAEAKRDKNGKVKILWSSVVDNDRVVYRVYRIETYAAESGGSFSGKMVRLKDNSGTDTLAGAAADKRFDPDGLFSRVKAAAEKRWKAKGAGAGKPNPPSWLGITDPNPPPDNHYHYVVTSLYAGRPTETTGTWTSVVPVPATAPPKAPVVTKVEFVPQDKLGKSRGGPPPAGAVHLSWAPIADARSYNIYRVDATGYFDRSLAPATPVRKVVAPKATGAKPKAPTGKGAGPAKTTLWNPQQKTIKWPDTTLPDITKGGRTWKFGLVTDFPKLDNKYVLVGRVAAKQGDQLRTEFYDHLPPSQAHTYGYRVVAVNRWNMPGPGDSSPAQATSVQVDVPSTMAPSTPILMAVSPDEDGYVTLKMRPHLKDQGTVNYNIYRSVGNLSGMSPASAKPAKGKKVAKSPPRKVKGPSLPKPKPKMVPPADAVPIATIPATGPDAKKYLDSAGRLTW
jgi:hypothetical protein